MGLCGGSPGPGPPPYRVQAEARGGERDGGSQQGHVESRVGHMSSV